MTGATIGNQTDIDVFDCLAGRGRRVTLAVLQSAPDGISLEALAARVAARRSGASAGEASPEERRRAETRLHHQHLPRLADAGLIERDPDRDRIDAVDHPALDDPFVRRAIETPTDGTWLDETFEALAKPRRRRVLAALGESHRPIGPREIAALVAARENDCSRQDVGEAAVDRVQASLRHVHLPKLLDADLVERDGDGWTTTEEPATDRESGFAADWAESEVA